jgi:hypothetical protein
MTPIGYETTLFSYSNSVAISLRRLVVTICTNGFKVKKPLHCALVVYGSLCSRVIPRISSDYFPQLH